MEGIGARMKCIREHLGLSQKVFAERMGFSRDVISNIEYERTEAKEYVLKAICREFSVDRNWLVNGTGDMFVQPDSDAVLQVIDQVLSGENQIAFRIIKALSVLEDQDWKVLEKLIHAFAKENEKES